MPCGHPAPVRHVQHAVLRRDRPLLNAAIGREVACAVVVLLARFLDRAVESATYVLLLVDCYRDGGTAPVLSDLKPGSRPLVDPVVQALALTDVVVGATVTAVRLIAGSLAGVFLDLTSTGLAVGVAARAVLRPTALGEQRWAPPLRRLQSGHIGDYVAWLPAGATLLGPWSCRGS